MIIALLFILIVGAINLPFVHTFLTAKTNSILEEKGIPLHIGKITLLINGKVGIREVELITSQTDTIIYVESVSVDLGILPLFSKSILIKDVSLNNAVVNIVTNPENNEINIVSAFITEGNNVEKPKEETEKPAVKKSWDINGKNVSLNNIRFKFSDSAGGILVKQNLGNAEIDIDYFSLLNRQVDIRKIGLDRVDGMVGIWEGIKKEEQEKQDTTERTTDWKFSLKQLKIADVIFSLDQPDIGQSINVTLEKGNISPAELDLLTSEINVGEVELNKPVVTFVKDSIEIKEVEIQPSSTSFSLPMLSWTIVTEKIEINKGLMTYNNSDSSQSEDLEKWLPIQEINASFKDTWITPVEYNMDLKEISFALANTLNIESGSIYFKYDSLNNIKFKSNLSALLNENKGLLVKKQYLDFATTIEGDTSAFQIQDFDFISTNGIQFNLFGTLLHPFQIQNSVCDIQFATSAISHSMLEPVIYNFNPQIKVPQFSPVSFTGNLKNTVFNPFFNLSVKSASGQIKAVGNYDIQKTQGKFEVLFTELMLNELLGETYPEKLTGKVILDGGLNNDNSPEGLAIIDIDSVRYKDKTTHNIEIQATVQNNKLEFTTTVADSVLICNLNGQFGWSENELYYGAIEGNLDIDVFAMELTSTPLAGRGNINANFRYSSDSIKSYAAINDVSISNKNATQSIDKIVFELNSNENRIESFLESDFLKASFKSEASFSEIKNAYDSTELRTAVKLDSTNFINLGALTDLDSLKLDATLKYDSFFNLIYPDSVLNFSDIILQINKTEKDSLIKGTFSSEWIKFNKINSFNTQILASVKPDRLSLDFNTDRIVDNEVKFGGFGINIDVLSTSMVGTLTVADENGDKLHQIGFEAQEKNDLVVFKSSLQEWILNKNLWTLSPLEFLTWDKTNNTFIATLNLHFEDHYIGIQSDKAESIELKLKNVEFNDFALPGLVDFVPNGIIDGSAKYSKTQNNNLDLNLQISKFEWRNISFNHIEAKGNLVADSTGILNSEIYITADDSVSAMVQLETNKVKNEFEIKSKFKKLHFYIFEPFIKEFASNLHGTSDGEVTISDINNSFQLDGEIRFNNFGLKVIPLKTWLNIPANKIVLKQNKFIFENFTVTDSLKRPLTVNGNVHFIDKDDIRLNMNVMSKKIQLMNTSESKNAPLYGSIVVNSGLNIGGSVKRPTIKGDIEFDNGTNLTYQLIQNLSVRGSQSDVFFATITDSLDVLYPVSSEIRSITKMPKIQTTVRINPKSILNVKIDDLYNVDISVTGNGLLNYNMLPNNTMSLNGVYSIKSGNCDLKITGWPIKKFTITPGSSLNWNGNVENPELNLEATSNVRGSYFNPLDGKTRVVDFIVTMQLSKQLSDLEIIFGVQSTDQYITSVLGSLSSDEMMRQSINLLLFSTIEIPGVESSSNYLSSQISSFWESQINSFTSSNMNKTKLSFGIDTYNYSSAQGAREEKTSLTYQMERKFMNDRVTIKLSGKLNDYYEGKYQTNSLFENFVVEYALDSLNTKNIKLYQKRDYEDMLEGEVIKYGVGFLYRKSYKKLSDIWRRKKKTEMIEQKKQ